MKSPALALLALLTLTGCAGQPTPQELATADYGVYPVNYEEIIRNHMNLVLKDPESARYEFLNTPKTAWNSWGGRKYGYVVCALINAKNSYGGYTGNQLNYFMIKNGRVIEALDRTLAQTGCKNTI